MGTAAPKVKEEDLPTRAAAAAAEQQRLQALSERAGLQLECAKLAAKQKPTREAVMDVEVARLEAENASEAAAEHQKSIAELLAEADRHQRTLEFETAAARASGVCFEKQRQRVEDLVAEFRRALRGSLVELQEFITQHNTSVSTANRLAQGLGRPEQYSPRTLEDVVSAIALTLNAGKHPAIGYPTELTFKSFTLNGDELSRRFLIEINGPIAK